MSVGKNLIVQTGYYEYNIYIYRHTHIYQNRVNVVIILDSIVTTSIHPRIPHLLSKALRKDVKIGYEQKGSMRVCNHVPVFNRETLQWRQTAMARQVLLGKGVASLTESLLLSQIQGLPPYPGIGQGWVTMIGFQEILSSTKSL